MEPQIQYARTKDGVDIGFSVTGEGPPLIVMPIMPLLGMQMARELKDLRYTDTTLGRRRTLIRYDGRGFGYSDRSHHEFTLDTLGMDLEAVVDRLALGSFDIHAVFNPGPAAIAFAARNPDRVGRLSLQASFADGASFVTKPMYNAFFAMRKVDWTSYVKVLSRQVSSDPRAAGLLAESASEENYDAFIASLPDMNAGAYLAEVQAATLVVAVKESGLDILIDDARSMAARIQGARLVVADTVREGFEAAAGFMSEGVVVEVNSAETREASSGTAIILFADIVDSTLLTERLGDSAFREKARDLDGALRTIIRDNGGTPIEGKLLGDGVLATFASASQAIRAALACGKAGEDGGLPLHLGLHAGDVIREDNNVFGGAVNVAARISGLSEAGEVLVSDIVRGLARTSAGVSFEDRGEQELKGVGEAVRVWAVIEGE
jgi:class 3 adenylate cyclase